MTEEMAWTFELLDNTSFHLSPIPRIFSDVMIIGTLFKSFDERSFAVRRHSSFLRTVAIGETSGNGSPKRFALERMLHAANTMSAAAFLGTPRLGTLMKVLPLSLAVDSTLPPDVIAMTPALLLRASLNNSAVSSPSSVCEMRKTSVLSSTHLGNERSVETMIGTGASPAADLMRWPTLPGAPVMRTALIGPCNAILAPISFASKI